MDHHVFDTVTRLFGAAGSRRTAWRTLLAGALLGFTTRSAAAAPCANGKHTCGEGKECCPGKCFADECTGYELCCTGETLIICGNRCCMAVTERGVPIENPCQDCIAPPAPFCPDPHPGGIAGSYRRR